MRFRFYRQFFLFLFYFLISLVCFTLRPGPPPTKPISGFNSTKNLTISNMTNDFYNELTTALPKWYKKTLEDPDNSSRRALNVIMREVILTSLKDEDIERLVAFNQAKLSDDNKPGLICSGNSIHSCVGNETDIVAVFGKGKSPKVPKPGASSEDFVSINTHTFVQIITT